MSHHPLCDSALLDVLGKHNWANSAVFMYCMSGATRTETRATLMMLRKNGWQATIWNEWDVGSAIFITPYIPEPPQRPRATRMRR